MGTINVYNVKDFVAYSGNRNITLPKIVNTKTGKVYYVSKNDSTSHYVKIVPSPGDSITGVTQINQIHQTLMIIHTGPRWYSIKIS